MPATHRCSRCAATYDENNLAAGVTAGLASEAQHCVNGHIWVEIGNQQHQAAILEIARLEDKVKELECNKKDTSQFYKERYNELKFENYDFIKDFRYLHNKNSDLKQIEKKLKDSIKIMESLKGKTFENENEMNIFVCEKLNQLLSKWNVDNKMECISMHDQEYFASSRLKPDNVICYLSMIDNNRSRAYPGPITSNMVADGKLSKCCNKENEFKMEHIGQIGYYLKLSLFETECNYRLGFLYNEYKIQFFQIKTESKNTLIKSNVYNWNDLKCMKILYHFCVDLSNSLFENELKSKLVYPMKFYFDNGISPLGIIGEGATAVTLGVRHEESERNNKSERKWDKKALKMYDVSKLDDYELFEKLKENEISTLKAINSKYGEMKNDSLPFAKSNVITNNNNSNQVGILMPILNAIDCRKVRRRFAFKTAQCVRDLHLKYDIFHGDIYWNNIMYDKNENVKIIDFQTCIFNNNHNSNDSTSFEHRMKDIRKLFHLIGKEPTQSDIEKWRKYDLQNKVGLIYRNILSIFEQFSQEKVSSPDLANFPIRQK